MGIFSTGDKDWKDFYQLAKFAGYFAYTRWVYGSFLMDFAPAINVVLIDLKNKGRIRGLLF